MKRKNVKTKKKEEINFFSLPSTKISIIYYLISTAILIVVETWQTPPPRPFTVASPT